MCVCAYVHVQTCILYYRGLSVHFVFKHTVRKTNCHLYHKLDVEKLVNYIWFGNVIPELKKARKIFGIETIFPFSLSSRG